MCSCGPYGKLLCILSSQPQLIQVAVPSNQALALPLLQWGTLEYHQQSLRNLEEAVRRSRVMCAIMVDTLGRELMIRRPFSLNEDGWPVHNQASLSMPCCTVKVVIQQAE